MVAQNQSDVFCLADVLQKADTVTAAVYYIADDIELIILSKCDFGEELFKFLFATVKVGHNIGGHGHHSFLKRKRCLLIIP